MEKGCPKVGVPLLSEAGTDTTYSTRVVSRSFNLSQQNHSTNKSECDTDKLGNEDETILLHYVLATAGSFLAPANKKSRRFA
jgi:hypothetical protein